MAKKTKSKKTKASAGMSTNKMLMIGALVVVAISVVVGLVWYLNKEDKTKKPIVAAGSGGGGGGTGGGGTGGTGGGTTDGGTDNSGNGDLGSGSGSGDGCKSDSKKDGVFTSECMFPFTFMGKTFNGCTNYDGPGRPGLSFKWCSHDSKHVTGRWGKCKPDCNKIDRVGVPPTMCLADTKDNGDYDQKCKFPFKYKGVQYDKCTSVDANGWFWCAFDSDYKEDRWGYCNEACGRKE